VNKHKFHFVWDNSLDPSDSNWSLTIDLQSNEHRAGGFSLYRKSTRSPVWMDLNVFTTTGFSAELAQVIERLQGDWLGTDGKPGATSRRPSASVAGD
jgi:hypothetical protein